MRAIIYHHLYATNNQQYPTIKMLGYKVKYDHNWLSLSLPDGAFSVVHSIKFSNSRGGVFRLLNMGKNGDKRYQRPHVTLWAKLFTSKHFIREPISVKKSLRWLAGRLCDVFLLHFAGGWPAPSGYIFIMGMLKCRGWPSWCQTIVLLTHTRFLLDILESGILSGWIYQITSMLSNHAGSY